MKIYTCIRLSLINMVILQCGFNLNCFINIGHFFHHFWLAAGSKPVFMSFSDTQCLFLDVALLVEILKLHLMTIGANTMH